MAPFTNICIENKQSSPTCVLPEQSKPEPFCSFCLRERPQNVEFYKHVIGASQEMRNSLQSMLGYDFNLANFAICKPCWKVIQLIQDFRLRCFKANEVLQRMSKGLSIGDDGWFSSKNLAMIENVRMSVQDQMRHMEQINTTKRELFLDVSTDEQEVEQNDDLKLEFELSETSCEQEDTATTEMDEVRPEQPECSQCHKTSKSNRGPNAQGPFCAHHLELPSPDYFKNQLEKHGTIATFQCTQHCDKLFFSEPRRAHHERICAENARNLACATCGKRFKTRFHLRSHEWGQHTENARIFPCKVCGKMFKSQYAVNEHMKSHATRTRELFECGSCSATFWHKRSLTHHLKTFHANKVAGKGVSES